MPTPTKTAAMNTAAPLNLMTIITVTGWGQAEDMARTHAAGFDHHIVKPATLSILRELLGSARHD